MSRVYHNGMNEIVAAVGWKEKSNSDNKPRLKVQRDKFARCRKCGGQMTYVPNTNIFYCENMIEVEKTTENADGTTTVKTVKQICANINLVDKEYQGYMRYLFG